MNAYIYGLPFLIERDTWDYTFWKISFSKETTWLVKGTPLPEGSVVDLRMAHMASASKVFSTCPLRLDLSQSRFDAKKQPFQSMRNDFRVVREGVAWSPLFGSCWLQDGVIRTVLPPPALRLKNLEPLSFLGLQRKYKASGLSGISPYLMMAFPGNSTTHARILDQDTPLFFNQKFEPVFVPA